MLLNRMFISPRMPRDSLDSLTMFTDEEQSPPFEPDFDPPYEPRYVLEKTMRNVFVNTSCPLYAWGFIYVVLLFFLNFVTLFVLFILCCIFT